MPEWLKSIIDRFRSNPPPVVAAVRLEGPIGPATRMRTAVNLEGVAKLLSQAFSMRNLKAVAITVNSPGGSPVQSALIMQRVRALAEETDVPVLVFAEDVAASGGYLLALAGDEIFAHETSIIGSIGVVFAGFGFSDAISRLGIERRLYSVFAYDWAARYRRIAMLKDNSSGPKSFGPLVPAPNFRGRIKEVTTISDRRRRHTTVIQTIAQPFFCQRALLFYKS